MNYLILCDSKQSREELMQEAFNKYPDIFERVHFDCLTSKKVKFFFFTTQDFSRGHFRGIVFENFTRDQVQEFYFNVNNPKYLYYNFINSPIPDLKLPEPKLTCCFCDQEKDLGLLRNTKKGLCRDCVKQCYDSHIWNLSQQNKDYKLQLLQEILAKDFK
jgi:hypothetical protein